MKVKIILLPEQATEEITDLGPAADLKASDPAPKSNPAPHHNVEELPKASKDSCSTNNSKEAPQQSESVEHLALCLVHLLKFSSLQAV